MSTWDSYVEISNLALPLDPLIEEARAIRDRFLKAVRPCEQWYRTKSLLPDVEICLRRIELIGVLPEQIGLNRRILFWKARKAMRGEV